MGVLRSEFGVLLLVATTQWLATVRVKTLLCVFSRRGRRDRRRSSRRLTLPVLRKKLITSYLLLLTSACRDSRFAFGVGCVFSLHVQHRTELFFENFKLFFSDSHDILKQSDDRFLRGLALEIRENDLCTWNLLFCNVSNRRPVSRRLTRDGVSPYSPVFFFRIISVEGCWYRTLTRSGSKPSASTPMMDVPV